MDSGYLIPSLTLDHAPFTIDNLPYGVVSKGQHGTRFCAAAIGYHVVNLQEYQRGHSAHEDLDSVFQEPSLNAFAALPRQRRQAFREQLQHDLRSDNKITRHLRLLDEVICHLPMQIGGFSDFYTSLEHCQNVSFHHCTSVLSQNFEQKQSQDNCADLRQCSGEMTSSAIAKNWWYAPSVYNSRTSSILPSPRTFPRPSNVSFENGVDSRPIYGPSRKMDFELEMGYFVSKPIPHGHTMSIADAKEHIFGFVMLNDWSARDHQLFEMRPLGPFHSKGFATSISNWIVPIEALEPFSCRPHNKQDPEPFKHLTWPNNDEGALDIKLRIKLVRDGKESMLGTSNLKYLYWTPYQQLAHHAASGCGMQTGDLIGTGTISGSGVDENGRKTELGCLYEAERTKTQILPQGSGKYEAGYLEDGDEIILEGWCEDGNGKVVLGFGECRGKIDRPHQSL